jgi:hypothetical protein
METMPKEIVADAMERAMSFLYAAMQIPRKANSQDEQDFSGLTGLDLLYAALPGLDDGGRAL